MERFNTRGESLEASFDDIARYFKSPASKAIEDKSELFARCATELREFILAVHGTKVQAIAAGSTEPRGAAKNAYLNTRQTNSEIQYTRGTSSMISSKSSSKLSVKDLLYREMYKFSEFLPELVHTKMRIKKAY